MAFVSAPARGLTRLTHRRAVCGGAPPSALRHARDRRASGRCPAAMSAASPSPPAAVAPIDGDALLARVLPPPDGRAGAPPVAAPLPACVVAVRGDDRLAFLHNQSTADVKGRSPGDVVAAALTTHTARLTDVVTLVVTPHEVLVVGSPGVGGALMARFDKYLFPGDAVELADVTAAYSLTAVVGGGAAAHLAALPTVAAPPGDGAWVAVGGGDDAAGAGADGEPWLAGAALLGGSGLGVPGYRVLARRPPGGGAAAAAAAAAAEGIPTLAAAEVAALRVWAGVPTAGAEISDGHNPLEARLWGAVSFDKGCYLGQETIARLRTYDGVRTLLYGVDVGAAPGGGGPLAIAPGDAVRTVGADAGAKAAGAVTSVVPLAGGGAWALAYMRKKGGAAAPGVEVLLGDGGARGVVREIVNATDAPLAP